MQSRPSSSPTPALTSSSGAISYACTLLGDYKTKSEIAVAANVTTLTARNRYKELKQELALEEEDTPKKMKERYMILEG